MQGIYTIPYCFRRFTGQIWASWTDCESRLSNSTH